MGAGSSAMLKEEAAKPEDGSDLTNFDDSKAELIRFVSHMVAGRGRMTRVTYPFQFPYLGIGTSQP
jgi:hypothetical protein